MNRTYAIIIRPWLMPYTDGLIITLRIKLSYSTLRGKCAGCVSPDEFEHRYQAMIKLKKAELIEAVLYVTSSVPATKHGMYCLANV